MRVVLCEPGKLARITEIGTSLPDLQAAVDGYIEAIYPFEENVAVVCNEEGKINGLTPNRILFRESSSEVEMSYAALCSAFREAEKIGKHITGYIVVTEDSFDKPYSLESRTYEVSSGNKAFLSGMNSDSIFGTSIDRSDVGVRLDRYLAVAHGGRNGWKIERCYIKNTSLIPIDVLFGTFFVCGLGEEDFSSLTEEQAARYCDYFNQRGYSAGGDLRE